MMDETDIDDRVWQTASTIEGNKLKHSQLFRLPLEKMRDTMVLVSSSRGKFFGREKWKKLVHRNDEKRQFITVKHVIDPQSGLTMT